MNRLNIVWNAVDGEVLTRDKLEDRLLLFSLVYGLKPKKCLDIGTHKGGSAQVIVAALDECGEGSVLSIDPNPQVSEEVWNSIKHRCTVIIGHSPQDIPEEIFDFVFIDGNHDDIYSDLKALYPKLNKEAYVLCHDCYYHNVAKGIEIILQETDMIDCGILSKKTFEARGHKFLGSRLLRTAT